MSLHTISVTAQASKETNVCTREAGHPSVTGSYAPGPLGVYQMPATRFTKVETHEGTVMVLTKVRYLLFFRLPRTSIMPAQVAELGHRGVQFRWTTINPNTLLELHLSIVEVLREGLGLSELRGIADTGINLMSLGMPFIPPGAPLPARLKQVSGYVKGVI